MSDSENSAEGSKGRGKRRNSSQSSSGSDRGNRSGSESRSPSRARNRSSSPSGSNGRNRRPAPKKQMKKRYRYYPNRVVENYFGNKIQVSGKFPRNRKVPVKICRYLLSQCSRKFPTKRDQRKRYAVITIQRKR